MDTIMINQLTRRSEEMITNGISNGIINLDTTWETMDGNYKQECLNNIKTEFGVNDRYAVYFLSDALETIKNMPPEKDNEIESEIEENAMKLTESQLKKVIKESVNRLLEEYDRAEWVDAFGEEYVQRMESPMGVLLRDAAKELGSVINFERGYDGCSTNPIDELDCCYCDGDYNDQEALKWLISILRNYDLISAENGAIDIENSNHQDLAQRISDMMGQPSGDMIQEALNKATKKILKEAWTMNRNNAIKELHMAWDFYCKNGDGDALTSYDQRYVDDIIDELNNTANDYIGP